MNDEKAENAERAVKQTQWLFPLFPPFPLFLFSRSCRAELRRPTPRQVLQPAEQRRPRHRLGALAGLEVSIREHFAGFRSHSILLAGSVAVVAITVIALAAGKVFLPLLLAAGLGVFGISFWSFREAFKRRSGGVSFR